MVILIATSSQMIALFSSSIYLSPLMYILGASIATLLVSLPLSYQLVVYASLRTIESILE